jgi:hypothetical protein
MTNEKKPLEVVFAPGCFDSFDGTQEELDEMIAEIQTMFTNLTPEELEARSQSIDLDELIDSGEEELLVQLLSQLDQDQKRKLQ